MPSFLKTGLGKIRTYSTTWQKKKQYNSSHGRLKAYIVHVKAYLHDPCARYYYFFCCSGSSVNLLSSAK